MNFFIWDRLVLKRNAIETTNEEREWVELGIKCIHAGSKIRDEML